jgi:PKD repeat protein
VSGREYSLIEATGPSSPVTVTCGTTVIGRYDCSPTADAGPDQAVDEDVPVTFDGSGSSDDIGIVDYVWTFTDGVEKTLYGATPSYTFHEPGIYTVTLNVSDASDHYDTDTVTITVIDVNEPPTADAGPDQNVTEGDEVTFDGSSSSDDVGIENYTWTFTYDGEATELYGVAPAFTFDIPGTYIVTLTVEDAESETDADTVAITVLRVNDPPIADAGSDQMVTAGDEVTFDGSGSSDDVGIEDYTWTFTYDGEAMELYGVAPTFTFDIAGTYIVTLTVEDAEGETRTDTVTITVEEKSFIESYGLPLGIALALVVIALVLFFVLKSRKGGSIPDMAEDVQAGEAREGTAVGEEPPPPQS